MTFEHELRRRLHSNASDLDLHGGGAGAAIERARQRRHRRNAALGSVSGVALLVGSVGFVATRDSSDPKQAVGTFVLPQSGPLELEWTSSEGGVLTGHAIEQRPVVADDGTIYALSTAPGGVDPLINDREDFDRDTLYRLGENGEWTSRSPEQLGAEFTDLAAGSGLLYGVGTEPVTGGAGYRPVLSSSTDDGDSWDSTELPTIELPSDVVPWRIGSKVDVAAKGSTAVAVVTTTFDISAEVLERFGLQPEDGFGYRRTSAGFEITATDSSDGRGVPSTGVGNDQLDDGVIGTVTWSDLGVDGPDDLSRTDVYIDGGSGWYQAATKLADLSYVSSVTSVGDEFVATGSGPMVGDRSPMMAYASMDGSTWRKVATPSEYGTVVGLGDVWVSGSGNRSALAASVNGGESWTDVVVPADALPADSAIASYTLAAGPLGLAVAVTDEDGGQVKGVLVTRDLQHWSWFDLDGLGTEADQGPPSIIVGSDRVVVTLVIKGDAKPGDPSRSRTFVGTPVRTTGGTVPPISTVTVPAGPDAAVSPSTSSTTTSTTVTASTSTSSTVRP